MIDKSSIFHGGSTDVGELLLALVNPANSIDDRKELWDDWQNLHYDYDSVLEFFHDALFFEGENYAWVFCNTPEHRNFYELAMSLDMANIDPKAYYCYWILNAGHFKNMAECLREALEYDPDTILGIFPDVKEIVLGEGNGE